ncbi:MAG: rhomboid family intramembrane serine protease, partial [Candidatus Eremiobacteraeota bacterium]|nr:rhomboid family intramembrane serine protease [Candidatus Eremiobacteraeota bacterium]
IDLVLPHQGDVGVLMQAGVLQSALVSRGEWWRLITSGFIHFGFLHIVFNSYALWLGGTVVEYFYGSPRYALIYSLALLGGSFAAYYTTLGSPVSTAGASGAIMGVFGAMFVLGLKLPPLRQILIQNAVLPIILTLANGFMNPGISNAAHIGGAITGALVALALRPARAEQVLNAYRAPAIG